MAHEYKETRRIEFVDTDLGGVVHFSNFFRYMEATEHSFYRSLGLGIHMAKNEKEIGWPRVAATCEYLAPLRFDEEVEIHLVVTAKSTKTYTYGFTFTKGDTVVARGKMTAVSVMFDGAKMQAVPIPKDFSDKIEVAPNQ